MSAGLSRGVEAVLLPAIGVVALVGMTMPLDPGRLTPPDLVFCLMIAWVVRRPDRVPVWAAPLLGLLGDALLMRPIGLGALGLMLATEVFRGRATALQAAPFPLEWLAAALGYVAMLLGMRLVLGATFAGGPGLGRLGIAAAATAAAYPLVVLGLVWCLGLRPRGGKT
ncbi:MAG: rod shape-determining protein MreD [Amaricoccus sp.]|uniref:rod shape-determining protein MreD n=1 Tax=Amaricoccus sp. TaxID=1872485 RepID=UPI0039E45D9F